MRFVMNNIDKRLLAYKPISITLNFDWDNTTYDERVQMRHDYIEEQKKLDPNYVGWDFPEHFSSSHSDKNEAITYSIDFNKLVNTIGQFIVILYDKLYSTFGNKNAHGYLEINMYKNNKISKLRTHRIVGSTFIPIPEDVKENRKMLVINHKNDDKCCNFKSNLEWCTSKENTIKAYETGAIKALSFKLTVTRPGPLFGKEYYFFNRTSLEDHGFANNGVYNFINLGRPYLWGKWEIVSREKLADKVLGMDQDELEEFKDIKYGQINSIPWVGTIISDGPCKGEIFVIYGSSQLKSHGFNPGSLTRVINGENKYHKGCTWAKIPREEAVNIPIGLTEEQKEHIFGKTNK